RARARRAGRNVHVRDAELELLHYLLREVLNGGADDVIDDRAAVDGYLRGAPGLTADGDARVVRLRRVAAPALDLLDAGLQLRELAAVPAVQRQVLNLLRADDARDRALDAPYLRLAGADDGDLLVRAADFELEVERDVGADGDGHVLRDRGLEARRGDA